MPTASATRSAHVALLFGALLSLALLGCPRPPPRETGPSDEDRRRYARHQIGYALSFRAQGRHESAEHALDAALAVDPGNARARRLMAVVMEDLGRLAEAERQRRRADAIDPPPPLPPDVALDTPSKGLLVVIPPPEVLRGRDQRVEGGWPGGEAIAALLRRLHTRLPDADVVTVDPATLGEVQDLLGRLSPRAVLSLRIDRAYCGDNEKDGPFSLAWIRLAAATPDGVVATPDRVRHVEWIPPPRHCVQLPIGRALEQVLERSDVAEALRSQSARFDEWPAPVVRSLFPGLSVRIAAALEQGRARLATGRLNEALESFGRAAEIDPHDPNVRAYVQEAGLTLAMARELQGDAPLEEGGGDLEPQLTAVQRSVAEVLLAEERSRRDELLAALLVLDSAGNAPSAQALENLRSMVVENPGGHAERLAASLSEGPFEVRAYFAPEGGTLARYWFPAGATVPVLREEDGDRDGTLDRWQGYVGGARRHLWEDRQGLGWPDLHMTFSAAGDIERIEADRDGDRRSERLFLYEQGVLISESRDTDDDGHLDRVEFFDAEGFVVRREDDVDGDGEADVKSYYDGGRLVRREIVNLELIDELTD